MKNATILCLMLCGQGAMCQIQNAEWGLGYVFSLPRGFMHETIDNAHGGMIEFYFTPKQKRYSVGLELAANV